MRKYVIYEEVPSPSGGKVTYYHKADGDLTTDPYQAKIHKAENWIKWILLFAELIIKIFANKNLKYKELK